MNTVFDEVNARASALGIQLTILAAQNQDVETLRKCRELAEGLYNDLIVMSKSIPDYPTWWNALVKMNVESPFNEMDKTGEFRKLVEVLKTIDATGYYFQTIVPLMKNGPSQFVIERDLVLAQYDFVINMVIQDRRDSMKVVE